MVIRQLVRKKKTLSGNAREKLTGLGGHGQQARKEELAQAHEDEVAPFKAPATVAKDVNAHNALVQKLKESSSLQEDKELEVHGLVSAKLVSANVVSANLVSFILFTNRGLSTNRCCVLKSAEEH